ncbi:BTAD domain-containing putative transcriptional regulator [Streptomyces sp. NPDC059455]|uniref:BTAD domain-containing putative transcriptional regulator n=1 Tax=Streptomyces sp. NPDC059455 TaxID=3346837 RepID=UPI0036C8AF88
MSEQRRARSAQGLRMRVFGTMVALHGTRELSLGAPRHRALLGLLMVRLNQVVPVSQLIEELWGDRPPRRPTAALHTYICHLRRALSFGARPGGPSMLVRHQAPGYVLALDPDQVDAHRFERLVNQARRDMAAQDHRVAQDRLSAALALWRGAPYLELVDYAPMAEESARLEQARLTAVELHAETSLALGEDEAVVARLHPEAQRQPMRECLIAYLMTGLYRLGRQADALRLFERTRAHLAEELGVDAGAELQRIHAAILRQELPIGDRAATRVDVTAGEDRADVAALPQAEHPTGGGHKDMVTCGARTARSALSRERAEPGAGAAVPHAAGVPHGAAVPHSAGVPDSAGVPHALTSLPFVGRTYELAVLGAWADAALSSEGGLAAVTGQSGIGKTELTVEVTRGAREAGHEVIGVSCRGKDGPAYGVWARILRQLSHTRPEAFRTVSARYSRLLGGLLSDVPSDAAEEDVQPPLRAPFLVEDAVCVILVALARQKPFLLVLDDLQSADYSSLNLLHLLTCRLPEVPLGVLVTSADPGPESESTPQTPLNHLLCSARTLTLRLGGLSEQAVASLVATHVDADVDAEATLALHKRSGGSPCALRRLLSLA